MRIENRKSQFRILIYYDQILVSFGIYSCIQINKKAVEKKKASHGLFCFKKQGLL